ncbi:MAG: hypothetical protein JZU64_08590, partial [Rhodoferax sp.]|nr:hypothetical protein [Rhodoferax sp.]
MTKFIKINIKINNETIVDLNDLRKKFNPEIVYLLKKGVLQKWLNQRDLQEYADKINQIDISLDEKIIYKKCSSSSFFITIIIFKIYSQFKAIVSTCSNE